MFRTGLRDRACEWNTKSCLFSSSGEIETLGYLGALRAPIGNVRVKKGKVLSVVVISTAIDLQPADLVIHYHGGGAISFGKANKSLKHPSWPAPPGVDGIRVNDLHVSQIPQQLAASGKQVVLMIPQGPYREFFGAEEAGEIWQLLPRLLRGAKPTLRHTYVSGHSAGGPCAVRRSGGADGLFLFDPVIKRDLGYVKRVGDDRRDLIVYAAFSTSKVRYTGYGRAGAELKEHLAFSSKIRVNVRADANGLNAHHSMVSCGTAVQDKQVCSTAGYMRDYEAGSGNLERALAFAAQRMGGEA